MQTGHPLRLSLNKQRSLPAWGLGLLCAIAAALPVAHAQGVYKTIGPDGKVVYSDQPPGSTGTKYGGGAPAPAAPQRQAHAATTRAPTSAESQAAGTHGAKKATAARRPEAAPSPEPATDPALEGAVIGVLGIEDVVRRTVDICLRTLPTSFKKYSAAAEQWNQRNAATVSQARRMQSQAFDATQRQLIESGIRNRNEGTMARVLEAPAATRISWCDRSVDAINNGVMDVHNKPKLTGPLMTASAR